MCELCQLNSDDEKLISRRSILTRAVAGFAGMTLVNQGVPAYAQSSSYYRPIPYQLYRTQDNTREKIRNALGIVVREKRSWRTKYAFSPVEQRKLHEAVYIAAQRMLDPNYWGLALDSSSVEYHNFSYSISDYNDFRNAVGTQMRGLLRHGFPKLHIKAWDSKKYTGQAIYREAVRVSWNNHRQAYDISGEFRIDMSKTGLRERSAEETAGTIVHEMLHQMGHGHKNGYYDNNFITVFGDIIAFGRYVPRKKDLNLHGGHSMYLPG